MLKKLQDRTKTKRLKISILDINYEDKNFVSKKLRIDVYFQFENDLVYYIASNKNKLIYSQDSRRRSILTIAR